MQLGDQSWREYAVKYCVSCQADLEGKGGLSKGLNRRGSKDSQLR